MKISEICINRPVFAIVINLVICVLGYIAFTQLSLRELPRIDQNVVSVEAEYPGASAQFMESQVINRIENSLSSVEGLESMQSSSRDGSGSISLRFLPGYDITEGLSDIRDSLARIKRRLPPDMEDPVIRKNDPSLSPIIYISFADDTRSREAITDYVNRIIRPEIQQIEGVGNARVFGSFYAMRVWLQAQEMANFNVAVPDITNTLRDQNQIVSGGIIKSNSRDFNVNINNTLPSAEEFEKLIIRNDDGSFIRFSDVTHVELGSTEEEESARVNGINTVMVGIIPQTTANPLDISNDIRTYLDRLQPTLPPSMEITIVRDNALFIEASINSVYTTIIEAAILVIIIIFLFLGSIRSTAIPIVTIPLCLIGAFAIMQFLGYTINTMTLLALVLAIGMVVDDAIVMLENCYRHVEEGMAPMKAAIIGSKEVGLPIIAMTLTLAAVYAPLGFTEGLTGDVFREFAFTLAGTVIISGFVALTLSPMMCGRILKPITQKNKFNSFIDNQMEALNNSYRKWLKMAMNYRGLILIFLLALSIYGIFMFLSLRAELTPIEDRGAILIAVDAPTNASYDYMVEHVEQLEQALNTIPESGNTLTLVNLQGPGTLFGIQILEDWSTRTRSQTEIIKDLSPELANIPGVRARAFEEPTLRTSGGNQPLQFVIQLSGSYEDLGIITNRVIAELESIPGLTGISSNLKRDSIIYDVEIDRDRVALLNIDITDINETIAIGLAGGNVTEYEVDGEGYDLIVQMPPSDREDISSLDTLFVYTEQGEAIPVSSLITIKENIGSSELPRYNRLRASEISAFLLADVSLGDIIPEVIEVLNNNLPVDAKYQWIGQTKDFFEANNSIIFTVIFALVFIYLVLSAQFESFKDPWIIMLTVPFSILGAALLLKLTGGTSNLYTQIGFITLIGLITKHGILITEFANQLQRQGQDIISAVVEASVIRLRPILMTTAAMVLGAIPLALATGPGSAARAQIGMVIVGGMIVGTIFSLLVVPLVYSLLGHKKLTDDEIEANSGA